MTYRRCPYCEELQFQILEIDNHGDVQKAECRTCGYTGWCSQCDIEIEDPHFQDDPQHCSDRCAYITAVEREADSLMDERR